MKTHRFLLVAALALAFVSFPAAAAPGDLDFTFGIGGKAVADVGLNRDNEGNSVAVQGNGKIVVAGWIDNGVNNDFLLLRFNTDGTFDSSFGVDGKATADLGGSDVAYSLALQTDGKIIVAGGSSGVGFALVRFNADGTLDGGFGDGGKVPITISIGTHDHTLAVQSDGKIVVAGHSDNETGRDIALLRYNNDGTLDSGFGIGGKATTDFDGGSDYGDSIALQSDGKIVVAGTSISGTNSALVLVRYSADGSRDNDFGNAGKVITNNIRGAVSVAIRSDGKIMVLGIGQGGQNLARYNGDGTSDFSFGFGGFSSFGASNFSNTSMAIQGDGKIVVAGFAPFVEFDSAAFVVARLSADGPFDPGFGQGGVADLVVFLKEPSLGRSVTLQSDGKIVVVGASSRVDNSFGGTRRLTAVRRYYAGEPSLPPSAPVFDTEMTTAAGTDFRDFRSPAVDGGQVGGIAKVAAGDGRDEVAVYAGADGALFVQRGGLDPEGSTFTSLGDPTFGGEAVGFAGTARLAPTSVLRDFQMDARLGSDRLFAPRVRPGGKLGALYSRFSSASGLKRLAVQTGLASGTDGQFAKFPTFGLPRERGGLIFTGKLHHSRTVRMGNDFGIWREKIGGGDIELLLRTGNPVDGSPTPASLFRARGGTGNPRIVEKLSLMEPVTNATDQRRSFAPDGGVAAVADFDDDTEGVVFVAADGSIDVPVDSQTPVPDEDGAPVDGIEFTAFSQPATASGGRFALAAALRAAQQGVPPPPSSAVFSNQDGTLRRVFSRGGQVPGREGVRFTSLGQPLLGERGMIGLLAALTGQQGQPASRKAIVLVEDKVKAVVARLGEPASGFDDGTIYRRFISVVVTDSDPARLVFTGTVFGPFVTAGNNLVLWSASTAKGVNLILRTGQEIQIGGEMLTVRSFDALKAPRASRGQGRSTDADGFVTAKATLSDGRKGVLRIPLP